MNLITPPGFGEYLIHVLCFFLLCMHQKWAQNRIRFNTNKTVHYFLVPSVSLNAIQCQHRKRGEKFNIGMYKKTV